MVRAQLKTSSLLTSLLCLPGCGIGLTCGPGTIEQDGVCIVDETGYGKPEEDVAGADNETDPADDTDDIATGDTDTVTAPVDPDGLQPGFQAAYLGDLTFTDTAGMRAFCESYSAVYGSVLIAGTAVTELSALACLAEVHGHLTLDAPRLTVASLPQLTVVDLDLRLWEASALTNLQLGALHHVGGSVRFDPEEGAPVLVAVGLATLGSIGGDLELARLYAAQSVDLPALSATGGSVRAEDLDALQTLSLPLLGTVGRGLSITDNQALFTVAMPALRTIGDTLYIGSNASLTDLTSLYGLQVVVAQLSIVDNPALPTSQAQAVADAVGATSGWIEGNGPG